jgi:hypothetical protein
MDQVRQTVKISPGAESSAGASDDPNPQTLILIEKFPDFLDLSAGSCVDGVELLSSGQSDLDNSIVGEGDIKMLEV